MAKINRAWHTTEDHMTPISLAISEEQMLKDQERDENMVKIMTQMDLLIKHVMGSGSKSVNVVETGDGKCPDDERFDVMNNEEV